MQHIWTFQETEILKSHFQTFKKEDLQKILNLPWPKIQAKANRIGLKRSRSLFKRANLNILLDNSNTSFYWLGFILADGHLSKRGELMMVCAQKDKDHLQNFANYINYGNLSIDNSNYLRLRTMDREIVPKIKNLLEIDNRKTYNPPDTSVFEKLTDDQFISLFIGYIDGDGHIKKNKNRNDFQMSIRCHVNWSNILKYWCERIYKIFNCHQGQKQYSLLKKCENYTYGYLCITKVKVLQGLAKFCIDKQIPFLKRKWGRIDVNFVPFLEKERKLAFEVFKLFKLGVPRVKIVELINKKKLALDAMMTAYRISSRKLGITLSNILKIKMIDKNGREFFYKSAYEASLKFNINLEKMSQYLFENEIDHNGCKWKFVNQVNFLGNPKNL